MLSDIRTSGKSETPAAHFHVPYRFGTISNNELAHM